MTIYKVKCLYNKLLKEYASDDAIFTSISGKGGTKGTGKKADNIAAGQTQHYKDNKYLTHYEKKLPHLARITQDLKNGVAEGSIEIIGPALEELLVLIRTKRPFKKDEKGEWILPLGDNLRLTNIGKQYFVKYIGINEEDKETKPEPIENPIYDKAILPDFT